MKGRFLSRAKTGQDLANLVEHMCLCLIFAYFITLVQEQATLTNLKFKVLMSLKGTSKTCLDGENPTNQIFTIEEKESSSRVLFSSGQPRAKDYSTNHSSGSLHDLQHRK